MERAPPTPPAAPPPPPLPGTPGTPPGLGRVLREALERAGEALGEDGGLRELLKRRRDSFQGPLKWLLFHRPVPPLIQDGPQCGLVALAMAGALLGPPRPQLGLGALLETARARGYTRHGEMFSATTDPAAAAATRPTGPCSTGGARGQGRPVPVSRMARAATMGAPSPLLSEASAERLVAALSRARGAALKLGQLLSMADPALLPPQLQRILERLRHHAEPMPGWQSFAVLDEELGPGWRDQLQEFQEFPVAAASLGQVHRARLRSGADVAIKIQYPGVALSIGSDIENLLTLLSLSPGLPKGLFPAHSLRALQRELELECDYEREAASANRFRSLLGSDPFFRVPAVVAPLSSRRVLCTEWGRGEALERGKSLPQERRDQICSQLLRLCLLELFQFRFMQTDPNWANFLYDPQSHTVTLLDFGATREFEREFTDHYIEVIQAAAERDEEKILRKSQDLKFLTGFESQALQSLHVQAVLLLGEPFGGPQPWDFGALGGQRTARGVRGLLPQILRGRLGPPPEPSYALHRKLGGVFLACARLGGRVHCRDIFQEIYESYWGPQNPLGDPKIPGGAPGAGRGEGEPPR
ncbi:atypical kinase COQ8B, mitochondrial-like isoform X3 [Poecile atricapillus]|uniref:atypical kinase COQ8B, mitochondrial-like isoform X3 n=1 Tax=Poecile atricapillus TaxID=48891 RepID=UPI002738EE94|nr:atypical kinase COQ8B, mitochondrial-like isoform X3 [Poecile atricapillus]